MANSRLPMRKIVEVLRLHHEGDRSHREIARVVGSSPKYGLGWTRSGLWPVIRRFTSPMHWPPMTAGV